MRRIQRGAVLSILGLVVVASRAPAAIRNLTAPLSGAQVVPPNISPGTGICYLTLDDCNGVVNANCTFSGLLAPANGAHIHGLVPPGVNAGILIPLTGAFGTSGTLTGTGTLSVANVAGMLIGQTYVDIQNFFFPSGEIRGQIQPTLNENPDPVDGFDYPFGPPDGTPR